MSFKAGYLGPDYLPAYVGTSRIINKYKLTIRILFISYPCHIAISKKARLMLRSNMKFNSHPLCRSFDIRSLLNRTWLPNRRCSRKASEPTAGSVELPHHVVIESAVV